jgi:hypothetical protein
MVVYKNTFHNELDNKIEIKIKNQLIYNNNEKYKGTNIKIIGPSSVSENIITYNEAKELHKLLGKYLKENKNTN